MKNKLLYCIPILLLQLNCKRAEHLQGQSAKVTQDPIAIENKSNNKTHPTTLLDNEECEDLVIDMGVGEACIIKDTDMETVYSNIIKGRKVKDVNYYLSTLPAKDKIIEVNKNALMAIQYNVNKDEVDIIMMYEGGITKVSIEKLNNNDIKRTIYYYAD